LWSRQPSFNFSSAISSCLLVLLFKAPESPDFCLSFQSGLCNANIPLFVCHFILVSAISTCFGVSFYPRLRNFQLSACPFKLVFANIFLFACPFILVSGTFSPLRVLSSSSPKLPASCLSFHPGGSLQLHLFLPVISSYSLRNLLLSACPFVLVTATLSLSACHFILVSGTSSFLLVLTSWSLQLHLFLPVLSSYSLRNLHLLACPFILVSAIFTCLCLSFHPSLRNLLLSVCPSSWSQKLHLCACPFILVSGTTCLCLSFHPSVRNLQHSACPSSWSPQLHISACHFILFSRTSSFLPVLSS
jgi:hypothetical protein